MGIAIKEFRDFVEKKIPIPSPCLWYGLNCEIKELEKDLITALSLICECDTYKPSITKRIDETEKKLSVAIEALCGIENATDSHAVEQGNIVINKLVNEALLKIKEMDQKDVVPHLF
jgi:hypothetical protein